MIRRIHAIYATYLALFLATFFIPAISVPVRDFGMLVIAVFPAFLIWQRGLLKQRFWQGMAAANVIWGIGQITWIINQRVATPLPQLQDSAYWLFKLCVLGALLYRRFYSGTSVNRRLYHLDIAVALSIIAYYIGYFFILPSDAAGPVANTFYKTAANVILNVGITARAVALAVEARRTAWALPYRWFATGLTLYTAASFVFLINIRVTDPFWCAAFWSMSLAVIAAPGKDARPVETAITPYRYGLSLSLIAALFAIHVLASMFGDASRSVQDARRLLTFFEVVVLTGLLHARNRALVEESETRLQQLSVTLNTLRQPIYIVDGDYNIVLANEVFNSRFGAKRALCYATVFGKTSPCEWCELRRNQAFSTIAELRGAVYQVEFAPMKPGSFANGGVEMLVDVTQDRKRQQQLIQTERMAALGRMIAGTAHELNNPLAIVLGNAQLLRDFAGLTFQERRQVAAIASAAERARDIVHTFLTLSRPADSEKSLVDIVDVIRSVEHLKAPELRSYEIELDLELPASLPMMGRYTLLQEVFLNLIDNARDAIRQAQRSRGLIVINGRIVQPDRIRIEVSDNGTGVAKEHRDRIFDPFFSTKDVGQGTGLGLSIVHSIVRDHEGQIQVESDATTFARFEMEFKLVTIAPGLAPERSHGANLRILAVDDEPEILSILENSLGMLGHHVECTTTGARALQLLSKHKFDVLLLDIHLPEMDGRSIVKRIQAMVPPVTVRTIVITGDTISEDIRQFASEHEFPLVMKPVDVGELNRLLQETSTGN